MKSEASSSPEITDHVRALARVLWDYHHLGQDLPTVVDLLLVAGSHDDRVALRGAELCQAIDASVVVVSGGFGKVTKDTASEPEAVRFAEIMVRAGTPRSSIEIEPYAANMGDNVTRTRELVRAKGVEVSTGIIVTKPYMERRAFATASHQWPEVEWLVASPQISFEDYPTLDVPERRMIELMVGDLQRIDIYATKGFQSKQEIPDTAWAAYRALVSLGFDSQVLVE